MGLLQPESGLLFWMTLAFGAVFFLVAKFGFPVIVKAIDDRKHYIDSSLDAARKARQQLSEVETEKRMMRMEAEAERADILRTAAEERERMLTEARQQVALLAVAVTEKMLRCELQDKTSQTALAERLLDEIERPKNRTTCTPD